MRFAAALSQRALLPDAIAEVVDGLQAGLAGEAPSVVIASVTPHHGLSWSEVPARLSRALGGAPVIGGSAGGVLAAGVEVEDGPGLAVLAAALPGTEVRPFHLPAPDVARSDGPDPDVVAARVGLPGGTAAPVLLLGDPTSVQADGLAATLDALYPHATKVGGLVSGGGEHGVHALFCGDRMVKGGAVGAALVGDVAVDAIVAQGCRPVSDAMRVTGMTGRAVTELDGGPALQRLEAVFQGLDPVRKGLFQRSPMVGVATDAQAPTHVAGDFLVRHLQGVDPARSAFVASHPVQQGDVLRFFVRDASAAVEELDELLGRHVRHGEAPAGAWLVTCMGRGRRFYGRGQIDSQLVLGQLGEVPLAGFFGNGELGPVHARTHLHAYTAVLTLFRPRAWN